MTKNEQKIITITSFGHFMSHFNMLFFPALVVPMASYYGTNVSDIVAKTFWMYCFFGITALPWGMAADIWGAKRLMFIFHVGAGFSCICAGVWIEDLMLMSLFLGGVGIFSGIYHPTGLGWISQSISRISHGMAINGIFGNLGLAVAPLIAGLINWMFGMQSVFFCIGGVNLLGSILLFCLPISTDKMNKTSRDDSGNRTINAFVILLIAMMLGGVAYRGATVVLPAYFEMKNPMIFEFFAQFIKNLSPNVVASLSVSSVFFIGMIGQYTGGRAAEHFDLRSCYLIFHLICIPMAIAMAWLSGLSLISATMVYFFFLLGMQPIENTLVAKLAPPKFLHSAYGTKFILTFGVGSLAVKMVAGIEAHMGMPSVFLVLSGVSSLLVCNILWLKYMTKNIKTFV
jgi:MFS family permease